jgi:hypothetical protein
MAQTQYDLDKTGATDTGRVLNSIDPLNWRKFPQVVLPASDYLPAYVPTVSYTGGAPNTAPNTPVEHGTANATNDYSPRTQADKAIALGVGYADPINTPFGSIEPQDPYPKAGDAAPVAPTLTSLSPNTAAVGQPSVIVKAIGTGFTAYSVVEVGGTNYAPTTFVSPTELRFPVDTKNSVPGTISVKVLEHNIKTSAATFTFT